MIKLLPVLAYELLLFLYKPIDIIPTYKIPRSILYQKQWIFWNHVSRVSTNAIESVMSFNICQDFAHMIRNNKYKMGLEDRL